jgi:hypothetical protein
LDFLRQFGFMQPGSFVLFIHRFNTTTSTHAKCRSHFSATKHQRFSPNIYLKSPELGGQLTNKQFLNGMGFTGENQSEKKW